MPTRRARFAWSLLLIAACATGSRRDAGSNSGSDGGSGKRRVLLVAAAGGARPYLEMALLAGDDLAVDKLTPQEFDARLAARSLPPGAVIVLDGHTPPAPPPGRVLYFHPVGERAPFRISRDLAGVTVTRVRASHDVMRGVNFADSRLETTSVLEVDAGRGDLVLAAAGADTVIAARSSAEGRTVACGFRPDETTWVLQASFAVFVNNAIDWLAASP